MSSRTTTTVVEPGEITDVSGYCRHCDRIVATIVPARANPTIKNPVLVSCAECGTDIPCRPSGGDLR